MQTPASNIRRHLIHMKVYLQAREVNSRWIYLHMDSNRRLKMHVLNLIANDGIARKYIHAAFDKCQSIHTVKTNQVSSKCIRSLQMKGADMKGRKWVYRDKEKFSCKQWWKICNTHIKLPTSKNNIFAIHSSSYEPL